MTDGARSGRPFEVGMGVVRGRIRGHKQGMMLSFSDGGTGGRSRSRQLAIGKKMWDSPLSGASDHLAQSTRNVRLLPTDRGRHAPPGPPDCMDSVQQNASDELRLCILIVQEPILLLLRRSGSGSGSGRGCGWGGRTANLSGNRSGWWWASPSNLDLGLGRCTRPAFTVILRIFVPRP